MKIKFDHKTFHFVFSLHSWSWNSVSDFHSNQKNNNYAEGKCNLICWRSRAYSINIKAQSAIYFGMHAIGIFLISWDVLWNLCSAGKSYFLLLYVLSNIYFSLLCQQTGMHSIERNVFKLLSRMNLGWFKKK